MKKSISTAALLVASCMNCLACSSDAPVLDSDDEDVPDAVGTEDVRLPQTHNQALAMAALSDTFNESNFSYHMKEGGRHDFNAVWEFCYHALQFFFPANDSAAVRSVHSETRANSKAYALNGTRAMGKGIQIKNGKKLLVK